MAQKWSDKFLGQRSNGGLDYASMRTGFVPATLVTTIPFGRGLVSKTGKEGEVLLAGSSGGTTQFVGFAAFSQEATHYANAGTGPGVKNAVYPDAYNAGDVVGLVDRGSVIVKVGAGTSGIQAGDRICLLATGVVDAYKNITVNNSGSKAGILIDAVAESDAVAGDCIGVQVYSLASTAFKY